MNLRLEIATVIITNVTETAIRFEREWKNFSQNVKIPPITAPRTIESTTSRTGSTITERISIAPVLIDFATPNETAKTIRPTASSRATTGRRISVTGPFALYCFTTISVAAGAVAVATAPRTIAAGSVSLSGIAKWSNISATSTTTVVNTA